MPHSAWSPRTRRHPCLLLLVPSRFACSRFGQSSLSIGLRESPPKPRQQDRQASKWKEHSDNWFDHLLRLSSTGFCAQQASEPSTVVRLPEQRVDHRRRENAPQLSGRSFQSLPGDRSAEMLSRKRFVNVASWQLYRSEDQEADFHCLAGVWSALHREISSKASSFVGGQFPEERPWKQNHSEPPSG